MDKSWITMPQNSLVYEQGVRGFIDFAFEHASANGDIICPCSLCGFQEWQTRDVVYNHLTREKFPEGYTFWFCHGESKIRDTSNVACRNVSNVIKDTMIDGDPIRNMTNDVFGVDRQHENEVGIESNEDIGQGGGTIANVTQEGHEAKEFNELARDGEQSLYEGCAKYSKLSFMVRLYHIKCLCGMTDKAMTMILELLQDAFEHADIPSSFNEAKKTITKLGLDDEKIHACPNNCLLNWGADDEIRKTCKVCNKSRWKPKAKGDEIITSDDGNSKNKDICDKNAANQQKQTVSHTLRSGKKRELELLETQTDGISSTEDIYTEDFWEEHSGHDQSMGFDVCRSKVLKSTGGPTANEIKELKSEIDALSEQVAFVVQHLGVQLPLNQVTDLDSRCSSSSYASHEPRSHGPSSPPT